MRKSLSVALALAWLAFAGPGFAAGTGLAAGTALAVADLPFKVLSAGKVAGQVEAGLGGFAKQWAAWHEGGGNGELWKLQSAAHWVLRQAPS